MRRRDARPADRAPGRRRPPRIGPLQAARALGTVIAQRRQPLHLIGTEARLQPLDQARQAEVFALPRREQLLVRRGPLDDVFGLQRELERRRRQLQLAQALAQEHEQVIAVARRLGERDLERRRLRRAVALLPARLVMHEQAKAAHERMLRAEPRDQPHEQDAGAVQHLLAGVGAGEELESGVESARRNDRLARVGTAAECRVELGEQRLAEAARQTGARQAEQVAELAQAHALQGFPMLAARAEQPHRRAPERLARGVEIEAARRRLDAGQHRRALRRSRRPRCATSWPSGSMARCSRCSRRSMPPK